MRMHATKDENNGFGGHLFFTLSPLHPLTLSFHGRQAEGERRHDAGDAASESAQVGSLAAFPISYFSVFGFLFERPLTCDRGGRW